MVHEKPCFTGRPYGHMRHPKRPDWFLIFVGVSIYALREFNGGTVESALRVSSGEYVG